MSGAGPVVGSDGDGDGDGDGGGGGGGGGGGCTGKRTSSNAPTTTSEPIWPMMVKISLRIFGRCGSRTASVPSSCRSDLRASAASMRTTSDSGSCSAVHTSSRARLRLFLSTKSMS